MGPDTLKTVQQKLQQTCQQGLGSPGHKLVGPEGSCQAPQERGCPPAVVLLHLTCLYTHIDVHTHRYRHRDTDGDG